MVQVYTAIITPFQAGGEIDYTLFEELIRWQTQVGIDGLVICGTNGEFPSLSLEEIKSLLKFTADVKTEELTIIAGTGRTSLKETIELCQFAEELADFALVVPPYFFKDPDFQGLYNYFKQLLESTDLPIVLYNIPKFTGISITVDMLLKLKAFDNMVGVKDSSGKIENTENYLKNSPNLSIYMGSDALIHPAFERGAHGCISAVATVFPDEVLDIKISYLAGQKEAACAAQEKVMQIRSIIKQYPNRAAIKTALSLLGFPLSYVRSPLMDLTDEQQKDLKNKLSPYISS